ncbi:hypothetical protein AB0J42_15060 [Nonomuraea sp. NPDC049649]|uniref:hypothetical protein n=1 Tax=Nonomuraea sp. NPDC049649 TaxID=3155776 RepID=UPI0034202FE0
MRTSSTRRALRGGGRPFDLLYAGNLSETGRDTFRGGPAGHAPSPGRRRPRARDGVYAALDALLMPVAKNTYLANGQLPLP